MSIEKWGNHIYSVGIDSNFNLTEIEESGIVTLKKIIEPWLSAIFQSEHFSLLIGSGLSQALAGLGGFDALDMAPNFENFLYEEELKEAANKVAKAANRGNSNIEDQIRVTNILIEGLGIMKKNDDSKVLTSQLNRSLSTFLKKIAFTENSLKSLIENSLYSTSINQEMSGKDWSENQSLLDPLTALVSFLLSFASRTASRERLHIFTTNYDRIIEYGADYAGLHILDRFIGGLEPLFRSSRLDIDMHYNPPGIRGEPRYLEGVVRLTKLHGSLDWIYENGFIKKTNLPFGPPANHSALATDLSNSVMIYPNSAKDRETAEYPYVELFRDYAAATCRPNSVLVTYGYGFGDEHINRTIVDMLTIPSTHLVIISYSDPGKRIEYFYEHVGRKAQISLLIGPHFGNLETLITHYLPKPAIDRITIRKTMLLRNREFELKNNNDNIQFQGDSNNEYAPN